MVIYNVHSNDACSQLIIEVINDSVLVDVNLVEYVVGELRLHTLPPEKGGLAYFWLGQRLCRPCYTGSGKIYLRATLGTYHKLNITEQQGLVINPRSFVACRTSVKIVPKFSFSLDNFWSGVPLVNYRAKGAGNLMILMPGPVISLPLENDKFVAYGQEIAAYSDGLVHFRERAGSGWNKVANRLVDCYRGSGEVFFCPIPNSKDAAVHRKKSYKGNARAI